MGLTCKKGNIVTALDPWCTITSNELGKVSSFYSDNDTTIPKSITEFQHKMKSIGACHPYKGHKVQLRNSISSSIGVPNSNINHDSSTTQHLVTTQRITTREEPLSLFLFIFYLSLSLFNYIIA